MFTKLINGEDVFMELEQEWDVLAQGSMTDTPFQTLVYQRAWWQHLHPAEGSLHTITVHENDNSLVAIASFYLLEDTLYFNGCTEETDYLDMVVASDKAAAAWTAVFNCIGSDHFPPWTALDLCNVPEASLTRSILPQIARERGFTFNESIHEVCPVILLPPTFDDYLNSIDSKQRREIQRKLRRAQGANVKFSQIGANDDLDQAIEDFLDLLQKSTLEKREWLNDGRRALFYEVAQAARDAGTLQLLFVEVNGRKAASLFNFDYNDRIWVYNSGLDPASFSALSLGVVITAKAIELAIENGRSTFDFLRGSEVYKYRFGAQDTRVYRIQMDREA